MANVVINGGQISTNLRNVLLTITSPTRQFIYATELTSPTLIQIGSNWIDTLGAAVFTMNFVLSAFTGPHTKTINIYFADDASGTNYTPAEGVSDSIELYTNIQLPTITSPINGAEVTSRSIIVQGTAEPGAMITVKVEALG